MLTLDLNRLHEGPVSWREEIPVGDGPWADVDVRMEEPVRADLHAALAGPEGGVHVTGALSAVLRLECRRCLTAVRSELDLGIDLLFDPEVDPTAGLEGIYPLETTDTELDLGPALREQLLLEVPRFPLCTDECRGLCPRCGADRNHESCDCTMREPDPRWDALRELQEGREAAG